MGVCEKGGVLVSAALKKWNSVALRGNVNLSLRIPSYKQGGDVASPPLRKSPGVSFRRCVPWGEHAARDELTKVQILISILFSFTPPDLLDPQVYI